MWIMNGNIHCCFPKYNVRLFAEPEGGQSALRIFPNRREDIRTRTRGRKEEAPANTSQTGGMTKPTANTSRTRGRTKRPANTCRTGGRTKRPANTSWTGVRILTIKKKFIENVKFQNCDLRLGFQWKVTPKGVRKKDYVDPFPQIAKTPDSGTHFL